MVNRPPVILSVADLAYSGGDTAKILNVALHRKLSIDLQVVPLEEVTTAVERLRPDLLIIGHRPLADDAAMLERWKAAGSPLGGDIVRALKSDPETKNTPVLMLESLI